MSNRQESPERLLKRLFALSEILVKGSVVQESEDRQLPHQRAESDSVGDTSVPAQSRTTRGGDSSA